MKLQGAGRRAPRFKLARLGLAGALIATSILGGAAGVAAAPPTPARAPVDLEAAASSVRDTDKPAERITWSVEPATADGPDDRHWIERELEPGESVTEYMAVRNFSRVNVTFGLSAADGHFTEKGRFNMAASGEQSTGAGTWIEISDTVSVGPDETVVVPFTIEVPADATPGDHAAGVAATVKVLETSENADAVGVEGRMGFRVMTRVAGELEPGLEVSSLRVKHETNWNPFKPGDATVTATVRNTGNVGLTVDGAVKRASDNIIFATGGESQTVEILPGSEHKFTAQAVGVWPIGPQNWDAAFTGSASDDSFAPVDAAAQTRQWAWPVPQALAAFGVALIVLALTADRKRKSDKIAHLVHQAREQGRAEALGAVSEEKEE